MGNASWRVRLFAVSFTVVIIIALAGCAPQARTSEGAEGGDAKETIVVDFTWSPEADCAICHTGEQESYDNTKCEVALHKDMECIECHADESALNTAHEGKTASDKMPARLKKTDVADEPCFSCHYDDREGLIAATDGTVILTDSEGTSRNPHDPEGIAEHETLMCADCHNMHSTDDIQERAMKKCESCHHVGVFACYTCHD